MPYRTKRFKKQYRRRKYGKKYFKRKSYKYKNSYFNGEKRIKYFKARTNTITLITSGSIIQSSTLSSSTTADAVNLFSPRLIDISNYTDYTNAYDEYRIVGVKLRLTPQRKDTVTAGALLETSIATAIDHNTTTHGGLPTYAGLHNYSTFKRSDPYVDHKRYFRPSVMEYTIKDPSVPTYINTPAWKKWIPASESGVFHFGLIIAMNQVSSTSNQQTYSVDATFYLQCRDRQ